MCSRYTKVRMSARWETITGAILTKRTGKSDNYKLLLIYCHRTEIVMILRSICTSTSRVDAMFRALRRELDGLVSHLVDAQHLEQDTKAYLLDVGILLR